MGSIIDILGSYFSGSIVLVALIVLTFYFTSISQHAQMTQISQKTIADAGSVIEYDFNKMGYRVETGSHISFLNDTSISFRADLDNDGVADSISYKLITVSGKKYLRRYVTNQQNKTWDMFCKNVNIIPRDSVGDITHIPSKVKSIELGIQLEEDSGNNMKSGSFWKRKFYPKNLKSL